MKKSFELSESSIKKNRDLFEKRAGIDATRASLSQDRTPGTTRRTDATIAGRMVGAGSHSRPSWKLKTRFREWQGISWLLAYIETTHGATPVLHGGLKSILWRARPSWKSTPGHIGASVHHLPMAMESSALITCLIATLLVPVVLSCTLESDEERVMRLFTRWKGSHSVNYSTAAEDAQRLAYFANHVRHADELAKTHGVEDADEFGRPTVFGGWADLARAEMDSLVGGLGPATVTDTGLPPFDFSTRAPALFARWKSEYNVSYSSETEEALRYANFQCYVRHADGSGRRADADTDAYGRQMRFSGWADLSPAEMSLLVGRTLPDGRKHYGRRGLRAAGLSLRDWHWSIMSSMGGFFQSFVVADPPLSFDWRNDSRAIITRAKYQVLYE